MTWGRVDWAQPVPLRRRSEEELQAALHGESETRKRGVRRMEFSSSRWRRDDSYGRIFGRECILSRREHGLKGGWQGNLTLAGSGICEGQTQMETWRGRG